MTKDVGRIYFTKVRQPPGAPAIDTARTVETEKPFRIGTGWALRPVGDRALVVGWWGAPRDIDETSALFEATGGTAYEADTEEIQSWASGRSAEKENRLHLGRNIALLCFLRLILWLGRMLRYTRWGGP